ncbi:hypothetical protein MASR1M31_24060 [Porphyromonadaceae bacterium]
MPLFLANLGFWEVLLLIIVIYFIFGGKGDKKSKTSGPANAKQPEKKSDKKLNFPFGLN